MFDMIKTFSLKSTKFTFFINKKNKLSGKGKLHDFSKQLKARIEMVMKTDVMKHESYTKSLKTFMHFT